MKNLVINDPNRVLSDALAHQAAGRLDDARALYGMLLGAFPNNSGLLLMAASIDLQQGRCETSRDLLCRALEIEPDNGDIRFRLGLAHQKLGEFDAAIGMFSGLPENRAAQGELGRLLFERGAYAAAALAFEKADLGVHAQDLAMAYLHSGSAARAESLLRELIHSQPGPHLPWQIMELGFLLVRQKRWQEALEFFSPLMRHDSVQVNLPATAVMVDVLSGMGRHEAAIDLAKPYMSSNWSHLFSAVTQAKLRQLAASSGTEITRAPHPHPGSMIGVAVSSLAHYGRFGQQLTEYLYMRTLAEGAGVPLETPDWVGHYVFELDDPLPAGWRKLVKLGNEQIEARVKERGAEALCGHDFFSPGLPPLWDAAMTRRAKEIFRIRDCWVPYLEPTLAKVRERGKTIVAIHIRRTDRSDLEKFQPVDWYRDWLREIWPTLDAPVLYLCSDDLAAVVGEFAEFSPVTLDDTGTASVGLEFLQDFYVLMHASRLAVSRSAFSLMAAVLNKEGGFYQPDAKAARIVPYSGDLKDFALLAY